MVSNFTADGSKQASKLYCVAPSNVNINKKVNRSQLEITSSSFSMKDYFMNLYEINPTNTGKSCWFVSLIQYLSYLDTYINDNFIEEKYEATINVKSLQEAIMTSPGVISTEWRHDNVNNIRQYINSHLSDDYQCYLMELYSYYNLFTGDNDPNRTNIGLWQY